MRESADVQEPVNLGDLLDPPAPSPDSEKTDEEMVPADPEAEKENVPEVIQNTNSQHSTVLGTPRAPSEEPLKENTTSWTAEPSDSVGLQVKPLKLVLDTNSQGATEEADDTATASGENKENEAPGVDGEEP